MLLTNTGAVRYASVQKDRISVYGLIGGLGKDFVGEKNEAHVR